MLHLHYYPSTASMVPHIVLEELAVPYQRVLVDRAVNAHKSPEYLKLNPNGLIAVLVQDGMAGGAGAPLVLYETAAIVLHLCDTHLGAGLAPPVGSAERAHFYKWLMWLTNTLQATLIVYFYPERWVAQGNAAGAAEARWRTGPPRPGLVHGRRLQRAGPVRLHLVPLDAQLRLGAGAWAGAPGPIPSAHAGPPGGATRAGGRAAGAALRLTVARGGRITHYASASPGTPAGP